MDTLASSKPVLFLDVDGVISLLGSPPSGLEASARVHIIDGSPHRIDDGVGGHIRTLGEQFELVWSTGWEHRANDGLLQVLEIPAPGLPALDFGGQATLGSAHWKLDAMSEYAGDRPVAWIDDNIDDACRYWALAREAPTLLVETKAGVGLTDQHVVRLLGWAGTVASASTAA